MDSGVCSQEPSMKSALALPTKKSVTYPGDFQDNPAKPPLYHKQPPALPPKPFSRITNHTAGQWTHLLSSHCSLIFVLENGFSESWCWYKGKVKVPEILTLDANANYYMREIIIIFIPTLNGLYKQGGNGYHFYSLSHDLAGDRTHNPPRWTPARDHLAGKKNMFRLAASHYIMPIDKIYLREQIRNDENKIKTSWKIKK